MIPDLLRTVSLLGPILAAGIAGSALAQVDSTALRDAVTPEAIRAHQQALADIAAENGGNRVSGTPGYDASVDYVAEKLRDAGYEVTVQPFHVLSFEETAPPQLARVEPDAETYSPGSDFQTMRNSGAGSVEGIVVPTTDLVIPPTPEPSSTSGCEPEDFPAAPDEPAIALVQRGTCPFQVKVDNAAGAGYAAVLVFNEGQPDRQDVFAATLATPVSIPALSVSFAVGDELQTLAQAGPVRARVGGRGGHPLAADRERHRRLAARAIPTALSSSARISIPSPRVPGSTTTAAARPQRSRSRCSSRSSAPRRRTGCASGSGAPRSSVCSDRCTTSSRWLPRSLPALP